jgi:hypothetical protein
MRTPVESAADWSQDHPARKIARGYRFLPRYHFADFRQLAGIMDAKRIFVVDLERQATNVDVISVVPD